MWEKWEPQIIIGLFVTVGLLLSVSGALWIESLVERRKLRKRASVLPTGDPPGKNAPSPHRTTSR